VPYLIALTRAHTGKTNVWPLRLQDTWPILPIPLRQPDDDVTLDVGNVFREVYDEAAYDLSIHYQQEPPPPALSEEEKIWAQRLLSRL
jgi:Protein of unknown function (DUF4058)